MHMCIVMQIDLNLICCSCCCVRVLCPTKTLGHMELGPLFKASAERLEMPGIELVTPCLQGEQHCHYGIEGSKSNLGD